MRKGRSTRKATPLSQIMFGEISAWFFKGLGGILPDTAHPGFQHILLRPPIVPGRDSFMASHESHCGLVRFGWRHENGNMIYSWTIRPGSSATLVFDTKYKPKRELSSGTYSFRLDSAVFC